MKLLNGEIFNAMEPLRALLKIELPIKTSYSLAKMAIKLDAEYQVIEDVRRGLIHRYGEPNRENPLQVSVTPGSENFARFSSDMDELFLQEVEVVLDKIYLPLEVNGKALQIEAATLIPLEKFVGIE